MKRVWHNDRLVTGNISISAFDRGLTLGDGLFETIAVNNGVALWRFEHLERLRVSAREIGIPYPDEQIENAIDALTHKTKGHHVLRLTLTRGEAGRNLAGDKAKPTLIGTLLPFDEKLRLQPASLVTSSVQRGLGNPSSRHKTLSYMDNILAAREAQSKHADDALMLNSAGRVACASISNVFLELDGALVTPALSEGILPGIMRGAVIAVARELGIKVRERQVRTQELAKADHIFITNSLRFVRSVKKLDGRRYATRSKIASAVVQDLLKLEQDQLILD
jgi:branched-chain amino acid aminotransferase